MAIYLFEMGVQSLSEVSCTSNPYLHQTLDSVENNYDTESMGGLTDHFQHLTMVLHYEAYAHVL